MNKINKYAILIICTLCLLYSAKINWGESQWPGLIQSDGKGYYSWLPAVFIYQDLNFGFFEETEIEKSYDKNRFHDYRFVHNGETMNKYPVGTAVCLLPFFLLAHLLTHISGGIADGYSQFYAIFVNIGAIFYLFFGLVFLKKLLKSYSQDDLTISFVLIAIVFGTHLFYYTIGEPSMSHIYSFAFVSLFLYVLKRYFSVPGAKWLILAAISLGMIVLIRPVNLMIIGIIPFIAGSYKDLKEGILAKFKFLTASIASAIIFFLIIGIQLLLYKIQSGDFFVYTYPGESFNFLEPHFYKILFSYKKGLFVYTPIAFVSLLGFIRLWQTNKFEAISLAMFLVVLTYILSSWWSWYYGGSFSLRAYVEYLPLFALLLLFAFNLFKKKKWKIAFAGLICVLILTCQIQTLQYRYLQIHWSEMTKEKYWDSFLRIDKVLEKRRDNK